MEEKYQKNIETSEESIKAIKTLRAIEKEFSRDLSMYKEELFYLKDAISCLEKVRRRVVKTAGKPFKVVKIKNLKSGSES